MKEWGIIAELGLNGATALTHLFASAIRAAGTLNSIGFSLAEYGDAKTSQEWLERSLELDSKVFCARNAACIRDSLGYTYTLLGRYDEAEKLLLESAQLFKRQNDRSELTDTVLHLSQLHERAGGTMSQ